MALLLPVPSNSAGQLPPVDTKTTYRRAFARLSVDITASITCHDRFQSVKIKNISRGGMLIVNAYSLFKGDKVVVKTLRGREFTGQIAWALNSHCGIKFFEPLSDEDPLLSR